MVNVYDLSFISYIPSYYFLYILFRLISLLPISSPPSKKSPLRGVTKFQAWESVELVVSNYNGKNPWLEKFFWWVAYLDTEHFTHYKWLIIDIVIILSSAVDVWILQFTEESETNAAENMSALRVMRLIRALRTVKLFRYFKDLWLLVKGLAKAIKIIGWVRVFVVMVLVNSDRSFFEIT